MKKDETDCYVDSTNKHKASRCIANSQLTLVPQIPQKS